MSASKDKTQYTLTIQDELVGSLELQSDLNFSRDHKISTDWKVRADMLGTCVRTLWIKNSHYIPTLCEKLVTTLAPDTFLYGIMSLPLTFAYHHQHSFESHRHWLEPKLEIAHCHWDMKAEEIHKNSVLLGTFLKIGAEFLGPASGNSDDRCVRVALGAYVKDLKLMSEIAPSATISRSI